MSPTTGPAFSTRMPSSGIVRPGRSAEPRRVLLDAFDGAKGDQYGSLLFLTASVYRVFGPQVQATALPAALASGMGTLAVVLTWGFSTRLFGRRAGHLAAWTVAVYPDAVILSAEPMREPFIMAGLAGALYGYTLIRGGPARSGMPWIVGGILTCLAVSPPFGVACAVVIGGAAIWEGRVASPATRWIVPGAAVMAGLALLLTVRAWAGIEGSPDPGQGLLGWWIDGVRFQMDKLFQASGWVQTVFGQTPTWSHVPLATVYGLVQPLLPAALLDNTGRPFMSGVMSARAAGWFAVLPVLIYVPLRSVRRDGWRSLTFYLTLVFLMAAILVSYRFAGDQWDSPRYRAALIPILAALVGWAWQGQTAGDTRWLTWTYGLVGIETLIIGWWYAGRYYHIPRLSLFRTLGVAGFVGLAYLVVAGWFEARRRKA